MTKQEWPREFLDLLNSVQNKRARTVVDHILEHGQVTTEELKERYGYNHPPRAARDVREQGIPLETFNTLRVRTGGALRLIALATRLLHVATGYLVELRFRRA